MKLKPFIIAGLMPLIAGMVICLAFGQPKVREHSHRTNMSPEYLRRVDMTLKLSSEGHTALYRKNYALAEEKLRQAVITDPSKGDVGTWTDLGRALDAEGRSDEAYAAYREAYDNPVRGGYSNFPNDVEALTHYGIMCEDNGQHEAAVRAYNKANSELNPTQVGVSLNVPADPKETPTSRLRALLNVICGLTIGEEKNLPGGADRSQEALEAFQEAAQKQPNDPRVQFYLGYGLRKAGKFAEARAAFQKAAALDTEGTVKGATEENLRAVQAHRR